MIQTLLEININLRSSNQLVENFDLAWSGRRGVRSPASRVPSI